MRDSHRWQLIRLCPDSRVRRGFSLFTGIIAVLFAVVLPSHLVAQSGSQSNKKQNLDLPFNAGSLGSTEEEEAPEVVVFYGQSFEGDGIFYCLDRSGSTAEGELSIEKRETIRNIMDFSPRIKFGVVFYDSNVRRFPASGLPADATNNNKAAANAWIMAVRPGTGTCVRRGLLAALGFANRSNAKRNVVIYLGDGQTTCPGSDENSYRERTLKEVRSRNVKNIQINAICVGVSGEISETFPKALATMNKGQYRRITR